MKGAACDQIRDLAFPEGTDEAAGDEQGWQGSLAQGAFDVLTKRFASDAVNQVVEWQSWTSEVEGL